MAIKPLKTYYSVTREEIKKAHDTKPGLAKKVADWWVTVKRAVPADWQPILVEATFRIYDPKTDNQRAFFEGAVVPYYAIQNEGQVVGWQRLKQYRSLIWFEVMGYEEELPDGSKVKTRRSSTELDTVEKWSRKLEEIENDVFGNAGFEYPDTEELRKLTEQYQDKGFSLVMADKKAKELVINKLLNKVNKQNVK